MIGIMHSGSLARALSAAYAPVPGTDMSVKNAPSRVTVNEHPPVDASDFKFTARHALAAPKPKETELNRLRQPSPVVAAAKTPATAPATARAATARAATATTRDANST